MFNFIIAPEAISKCFAQRHFTFRKFYKVHFLNCYNDDGTMTVSSARSPNYWESKWSMTDSGWSQNVNKAATPDGIPQLVLPRGFFPKMWKNIWDQFLKREKKPC